MKIPKSFKLSKDDVDFLDAEKIRTGLSQTRIVEDALKFYRDFYPHKSVVKKLKKGAN